MGMEMNHMPTAATTRKLRLEKRFSSVPKYDSDTARNESLGASMVREILMAIIWAAVNRAPAAYHTSSLEKLSINVAVSERAKAANTTTTAAWAETPRSFRNQ